MLIGLELLQGLLPKSLLIGLPPIARSCLLLHAHAHAQLQVLSDTTNTSLIVTLVMNAAEGGRDGNRGSSALNVFLSSALNTFMSSALNVFLNSALDTLVSSALNAFLSSALNTFLSSALNVNLSTALNAFLSSALNHDAFLSSVPNAFLPELGPQES